MAAPWRCCDGGLLRILGCTAVTIVIPQIFPKNHFFLFHSSGINE
jgi:hypothetical protein